MLKIYLTILTKVTDATKNTTGKKSSITYGYDKAGNRTSMTKDGATTSYSYNKLDQLTKATETKDGKETSNKAYTYDPNGNQTKEKDSVTNITVENTYDADNRLSTSITVNRTSPVAYDYDDFGVTRTIGDSTFFNEVCYTGGIYDASTGLYYLNARYYGPKNGRFITQDTYRGEFNKPSSLHLYTYCINNPTKYYDPSGHMPFVIPIGIALSEAAVTGILRIGLAIIVSGTAYVVGSKIKNKKRFDIDGENINNINSNEDKEKLV